jgi:hypothetical protein
MAERSNVAKLRLTAARAKQRINELALDSENLIWTDQIEERMINRGIVDVEVLRVLRTGDVEVGPVQTESGGWKCKITKRMRGGRDVGVVTVLWQDKHLILVTVEWEDPR